MIGLILRRLVGVVPTLFIVSLVAFSLLQITPGDPAATILGTDATNAQIALLDHQLGLDRPLVSQYGHWVAGAVHGDLGTSYFTHQPVLTEIGSRLPVTLSLTIASTILASLVGVALGVFAGLRPRSRADDGVLVGTSVGLSIPHFWLALLLVIPLAIELHAFPATGYVAISQDPLQWLRSIALGTIALSVAIAAATARQSRGALVQVMDSDYIRAARARGMSRRRTVLKHGLKNASLASVTVLGQHVRELIGGAVVVELVFGFNGLGSLAVSSVQDHDLPVAQGIVLVTALIVVAVNLLVDIAYGWLNPRIRVR